MRVQAGSGVERLESQHRGVCVQSRQIPEFKASQVYEESLSKGLLGCEDKWAGPVIGKPRLTLKNLWDELSM